MARYKHLIGRVFMGLDGEKIERLIERIDELLVILNSVAEDLRIVAASLKSIAVSHITPDVHETYVSTSQAKTEKEERSIEEVKMMFPEDLEERLSFEEKDDFIIIKPRQFLGSENFARIASIVRGMGGDYVSAGKESHFRVPKKKF
ncbi:MAG: hypothetical protein QXR17_00460 [Candidatus Bathyarchaeia archaeon]